MIENPKTLDDVRSNMAEAAKREADQNAIAGKIKQHEANGYSPAEAQYAANTVLPTRKEREDRDAVAQDIEKFKAMGLSDGEADFAANIVLPG
jgi:hypothetical protein